MNAQAFFKQGIEKAEIGDFQSAITDFNQVLKIHPFLKPTATGVRRAELKDYKGAIADFTQALRLAPDHADAYNKRGTVRAMLGDIQAMAEFDEALRKDPNFTDAYYNRACTHR